MIDRLDWLHISDFHFVGEGDEFSQQVTCQSLIDDVEGRIVEGQSLSFVLFSGDVAFSGKRAQYDRADEFLSRLATVVGVPPSGFFFVPGNHDIDRSKHRLAFEGACSLLASEPEVDRVLGCSDDVGPLIDRQAAFRDFVDTFTQGQERKPTDDGLGYVAPLTFAGLRVAILGLNSAWLSGRDPEEMKLLIGERQVIDALQIAAALEPQILIAMAHHPIEWLYEWDQVCCRQRLLPDAHFYHRGHMHQAEVSLCSSPEQPCTIIAAGSGHATRFEENSYNLVSLDLGAGTCSVRTLRYDRTARHYTDAGTVPSSFALRGSLPGTAGDLTATLTEHVPAVASYAGYVSDLISGHKAEIPVLVEGAVTFLVPEAANALVPAEMSAARELLKLRNLLRLYDDDVPLAQRITEHAAVIETFGTYLSPLAEQDGTCAERLRGRDSSDPATGANRSDFSHTSAFLEDLRVQCEWELLEVHSRRFVSGPDNELARLARTCLIEALVHSDETEKRREAMNLANQLVANPGASPADFLLAAAASEVLGDDRAAVDLTNQALAEWPDHPDLQGYARSLALRTGDAALRRAVGERGQGTGGQQA